MEHPYDPELAAADEFAEIAFQARRASADPGLSIDAGNALRSLADAADQLGRIVYAEATDNPLPPIRSTPAGAYAEHAYHSDAPTGLTPLRWKGAPPPTVPPPPDVTVTIDPATEEAR